MKVKIVEEVKRSDGLWRFACGDVFKRSLAKIKAYFQKSLSGGSVKADFLHGGNIDHAEKKALSSDFNWGPS